MDRSCEGRLANSLVIAANGVAIIAGWKICFIAQGQFSLTSEGSTVWRNTVPINGTAGNAEMASASLGGG